MGIQNQKHINWDDIQVRLERGERVTDVADLLGISKSTISSRAKRENWKTPGRMLVVVREAAELIKENPEQADAILQDLGPLAKYVGSGLPMRHIRAQLVERQEEYSKFIAGLVQTQIGKSTVKPPKTWGELKIANDIVRQNLGMDNKQAAAPASIQIGIVGGGAVEDMTKDE